MRSTEKSGEYKVKLMIVLSMFLTKEYNKFVFFFFTTIKRLKTFFFKNLNNSENELQSLRLQLLTLKNGITYQH